MDLRLTQLQVIWLLSYNVIFHAERVLGLERHQIVLLVSLLKLKIYLKQIQINVCPQLNVQLVVMMLLADFQEHLQTILPMQEQDNVIHVHLHAKHAVQPMEHHVRVVIILQPWFSLEQHVLEAVPKVCTIEQERASHVTHNAQHVQTFLYAQVVKIWMKV